MAEKVGGVKKGQKADGHDNDHDKHKSHKSHKADDDYGDDYGDDDKRKKGGDHKKDTPHD
jgi:hypothetical protein